MSGAALCSYFVLDSGCNLGYIIAQPDPTRGALREASQVVGTGTVLPAGHAAGARRPLVPAGCQVETPKRTVREAAFRLFPLTYTASRTARRATLDPAGSQRKLRAHRCWLFDMSKHHPLRHGRTCCGHPRLWNRTVTKAWMPGPGPGMTMERQLCHPVAASAETRTQNRRCGRMGCPAGCFI